MTCCNSTVECTIGSKQTGLQVKLKEKCRHMFLDTNSDTCKLLEILKTKSALKWVIVCVHISLLELGVLTFFM